MAKLTVLEQIFGDKRIVGFAGEKNCGKTNNLIAILKDFRKVEKDTRIYVFGLNGLALEFVKNLGNVEEISEINQLSSVENSLIIIDEFQKLKFDDRRYRSRLDDFISFIYHRNNWLLLCSPNLRSYNSIVGSYIERWVLKTIKLTNLTRGSQLKTKVEGYSGRFKVINDIILPDNKIYIPDEDKDVYVDLPYIEEVDGKKTNSKLVGN